MKFTVVTLFPELIEGFVASGLLGRAVGRDQVQVNTLNPRQFTDDAHHTVDDRAFGGSDGMVMKVEPLLKAIRSLQAAGPCRVLLLSPQGVPWEQSRARVLAQASENIVLLCGRYAGIDQRLSAFVDEEISLGDFVLNGGEVAACAIIESTARLLPGVLGNGTSAERDSFSAEWLECPQFTRPREVEGMPVPAPLLSGNHRLIAQFERAVGVVRTALLRPERVPTGYKLQGDVAQVLALTDAELHSLGLKRADVLRLQE